MSTREAGQSQASADALGALLDASSAVSQTRVEVRRLCRELRLARAAVSIAEAEETAALRAYEAIPYSDEMESERGQV